MSHVGVIYDHIWFGLVTAESQMVMMSLCKSMRGQETLTWSPDVQPGQASCREVVWISLLSLKLNKMSSKVNIALHQLQ